MEFSRQGSRQTGVGCHFLLQKIFLTQDWTHISCTGTWIFKPLNHEGSPFCKFTVWLFLVLGKGTLFSIIFSWQFLQVTIICVYLSMKYTFYIYIYKVRKNFKNIISFPAGLAFIWYHFQLQHRIYFIISCSLDQLSANSLIFYLKMSLLCISF